MEQTRKKNRLLRLGLGALIGGGLGFAYYALIGCNSGGCPIQSDPMISTLYGALVGLAVSAV